MKVVLWIGNESNQIALANKIAKEFDVVGIVLETKERKKTTSRGISFYLNKITERLFYRFAAKTWFELLNHYKSKFPKLPNASTLEVSNVNSEQTKTFTENLTPEIVCVSGTYLIKQELLSISSKIINLHTGLSPYIKGGPNCTNWCISTKQYHLIGNTIMWIDKGIDSGNIIKTECTHFDGKENFFQIHLKVMEHGHKLYLSALRDLVNQKAQSIPQIEIAKGVTYYSKQWNLGAIRNLSRNLKRWSKMIKLAEENRTQSKIITID